MKVVPQVKLFTTEEAIDQVGTLNGSHVNYAKWHYFVEHNTDHDFIKEATAFFKGIDPKSLAGLDRLMSHLKSGVDATTTIYGTGCRIAPAIRDGAVNDRGWLTVSCCWSGGWKMQLKQGTSPFGFGCEGNVVAELLLVSDGEYVYDKRNIYAEAKELISR